MAAASLTATERPSNGLMRIFRNPNFVRLWIGSVTSGAGTAVGSIIVIWLVYSATKSALAISVLGIAQFLPTLALGLLAGALIDRLDRRRLLITCDVARAVTFGGMALYILLYGISTVTLIAAVFLVATFSTLFRPATNAAIPRILRSEELADGNGLLQGGTTIAQFVGTPLGGLILLTVGAAIGLAINALTFAVSGLMIFFMVIGPGARQSVGPEPRKSLLRDVGDGLRYLQSKGVLLAITLTAMGANFFLSIWGGFTVVYAADSLHQGATGFAILVAANTAGFAIGAIVPGRLHLDRFPGICVAVVWGVAGFFIIALALTHALLFAVPLALAAAACISIGNTTWLSGVQREVPDEFMGRFFATDEAGSYAMIPAGLAIGGVLVVLFGIGWTYLFAGVGTALMNVPLLLSPGVRAWGRPRPHPITG
jgi:predicted MFS family arabinose efflux permease